MVLVTFKSAEDVANEMGIASDSLKQATNKFVDKTTRSTVTVVEKSLESHEKLIELATDFHTSFSETIEQINSVAKEFDRTDVELQNTMNQFLQFSSPFQTNLMK